MGEEIIHVISQIIMTLISFDTEPIVVYIPSVVRIPPCAVNATIVTNNEKVNLVGVTSNCTDN